MPATTPSLRVRETTAAAIAALASTVDRSQGDVVEALVQLGASEPARLTRILALIEPLRPRPGTGRRFRKKSDHGT